MEVVSEQNGASKSSNVYLDHGSQNEERDQGASMTSPTGIEVGPNEEAQNGRRRNRIGRAMLKPFKLIGTGIKKAVRCCFQCGTRGRESVVPVVEIVEDRNPGLHMNTHDKARSSPIEHEVEKNGNGGNDAELHEDRAEPSESRSCADSGSDMRQTSRTSGDEEKGDRETLKEMEGDARETVSLPAPVVVKKVALIVKSTTEDESREVVRSTSPSEDAASSDSVGGGVGDATSEVPSAEVRGSNEDSSEYEASNFGDFGAALVEEEVVMTSDNEDLPTEDESEGYSHGDNGKSFQDDSCLQFFASNSNESSEDSEGESSGGPRTSVTGEDEISDRTSQLRSDNSLTEAGEDSLTPASAHDSFDSDQVGESVESGQEEEGMRSSSSSPRSEVDSVSTGNGEDVASRSSNPGSRDGSPSGQNRDEGRNHGESSESQEVESMFGLVFSKLRSVLASFRRGNSEDEEQNSNGSRAERTDDENESSSNGPESRSETTSYSGSSPPFSSSDDGSSQSDAGSEDLLESGSSGECVEGPGYVDHIEEIAVSHNSSQNECDDDDDAQLVSRSSPSSAGSLGDSNNSSERMSSDVAESSEDPDNSPQVTPSTSAGSFEGSSHSSQLSSPASAESYVDSDHSSQVVTSSSADMLTDSDEYEEFADESE